MEAMKPAQRVQLFDDLVQVEIGLWNEVDRRVRADAGISLAHTELLSVIAGRAGCRVRDISEALSLTVGGTSRIVDRLERDELVRRESNPEDRRSSSIVLTDHGAATHRQAQAAKSAAIDAALGDRLDPHRFAALADALRELRGEDRS